MTAEDRDREEALREIADRYAWYEQSGYAGRWGGMTLAIEERDAWLRSVLGPAPLGAVLDVGCADGTLGRLLEDAGMRPRVLHGIDLLPQRVEEARAAIPWGIFEAASADAMPYPDDTFDLAVAMTLFSSLPQDWLRDGVAAELARVVRPGGRVVLYDLRYRSPANPAIRPVSRRELTRWFPGWETHARTLTLLPPLARSGFGQGRRGYRLLASLSFLRSHIAAVLRKPM